MQKVSEAGLYTDFNGLSRLKTKASQQSDEAVKEVARQFESLFLQMMLKSMRDATITGESAESDQTQFYQEMFDKQIALDLSNKEDGIGLAKVLQQQLGGSQSDTAEYTEIKDLSLIRQQIERSTSSIVSKQNSGQE